ncbi:EscU/YscU/HrcU family type III secretion system export apparatus switch protein [Parageobacillus sp. VR-IP]|jgi:flagellar biosynthesis protein|uniref:EscU/YscU/HrcU family type III secretion system export apparatus switch protein n=1 Tax=Parageobacillus sp. VR-IP TaxID=2742205 RepID=UPI00158196D9|nr:EscU/YscU/HrcU family type III secretion system export apparatus switch protein [Parageobacillus sp. VR-IP]NUK29101.1 EscU/YscU/HrcU family type III secretion system export apparatus switch protein [Parageobacillus sp. VR-IP]
MKNEKKQAVALSYDANVQEAPIVVAKGKGYVAEAIIAAARQHGIPIQEDPSLVQLLSELEVNEMIPEDLYALVAELFAFIYRLDRQAKME